MHNYTNQKKPKGRFFWFVICFRCVDTLLFALKHAEGMSLRHGAICPHLL